MDNAVYERAVRAGKKLVDELNEIEHRLARLVNEIGIFNKVRFASDIGINKTELDRAVYKSTKKNMPASSKRESRKRTQPVLAE